MSISYIPEQETYKEMTPFKRFVLQSFPWINENFDALTNYELMGKIIEYLNDIISNENTVQSNVQNLYNAFVNLNNYVSNYFDNLNVQTEINSKLDQMAQDGSLYDIIRSYTDPIINEQNARITSITNEQNARITSITNEQNARISAIASGSPAGVYSSVSALETADPSHDKIYVVSADGNWYFYNPSNSEWTSGGVYQSTVNAIDIDMIISKNNYELSEGENDGYFNGTTIVSSPTYKHTHLEAPFAFDEIDFQIIQGNAGTLFVKYDDSFINYNVAGYYRVNVENAKEIYMNFWGETYASTFKLKNKQALSEINQKKLIPKGTIFSKGKPNNLINYSELIPNRYVDTAGREQSSESFYVTPFIELDPNQTTIKFTYAGLTCFYNSSYVFISYVMSPSQQAIPEGAKYMRISVPTTALEYAMANYGTATLYNDKGILELPYKPYQSGFITHTLKNNNVFPSNESSDSSNFVDSDFILKLPPTYSVAGRPCKLLMVCHGAGMGVNVDNPNTNNSWKDIASYNAILNKFLDSGYAVFDCNGIDNTFNGCNFWGSPMGYNMWKKAYNYIVDNYNVEKDFSIYAFSMGGLTALNLLFNNMPNVKCVALGSPVIDLTKCWEDTAPKAQMKLAYDSQTYGDNMVGYDPNAHIIDNKIYANLPPIKIWYGSTETGLEVNKNIAQNFVNAIRSAGGVALYREVEGAGHEICYGENDSINTEYARWIERFNVNLVDM